MDFGYMSKKKNIFVFSVVDSCLGYGYNKHIKTQST